MGIKNKPITRPCPQCGRNYQYRRASGRTFELCEYCRNLDCVVCGKKVPPERGRKNTCCAECEKLKIHNIQNAHYAKRISEDPELNKRNHAKARENRKADPERMREHLEAQRERHYRRAQDPNYQAIGDGKIKTPEQQYQILLVRNKVRSKSKPKKTYRLTQNLKIDGKNLVVAGKHAVSIEFLKKYLEDNNEL